MQSKQTQKHSVQNKRKNPRRSNKIEEKSQNYSIWGRRDPIPDSTRALESIDFKNWPLETAKTRKISPLK